MITKYPSFFALHAMIETSYINIVGMAVTLLQIALFALLQGLTRIWPVSISGHSIILSFFTTGPAQSSGRDLSINIGILIAITLYFWRDVLRMPLGFFQGLKGSPNFHSRLVWRLVFATIPFVGAHYLVKHYASGIDISPLKTIAWSTLAFGLFLGLSDTLCMTVKRIEHLRGFDIFIIACTQILALIPGISRVGLTVMTARALGYERQDAMRFSILLSLPLLIGASVLNILDFIRDGDHFSNSALILGGLTCLSAFAAIAFVMTWLRRFSFRPFAFYQAILGVILLGLVYTGYL